MGVGPQKCMKIDQNDGAGWSYFYRSIDGFSFVEGNSYKISVKVTDVKDPPADGSSKKYELVKILEQKSMTRHMPYKNLCAPGFVPLNEICVLNDRCGSGAYPEKICVMDGIKQQYLKSLQQGRVGIAASDVICAEPLQLIFKYNASPACVRLESFMELESGGGWYSKIPEMWCSAICNPVCGTDNLTYGNMCKINAVHVSIKHKGVCTR